MTEVDEDFKQFAYDADKKRIRTQSWFCKAPAFYSPSIRLLQFFKEIVMTRNNKSKILMEVNYGGEMMLLSDFYGGCLPIHLNGFIYYDTSEDVAIILYLDGEIALSNVKDPENLRTISFYGTRVKLILGNEGTMKIVKPNYNCELLEEEQSIGIIYEEKYEFKERFYDMHIEYIMDHNSLQIAKHVKAMKETDIDKEMNNEV
jgi:hypothetical protein